MAEIKLDPLKLGMAVVVLVGAFLATQVWGRVTDLEARVVELNVAVEQLADVREEIAAVTAEMSRVRADVRSIAQARDDILRNICQILGRPPERCGVSPAQDVAA